MNINEHLPSASEIEESLIRTQGFLFATSHSEAKRQEDFRSFANDKYARLDFLAKNPGGSQICEYYARSQEAALKRTSLIYAEFGIFETRLRELRHYMDSQKPMGLRQLWKDNRDSLNYYTFWGVIIFGGLSVFLAFASLAVGIAQTYASFKSLAG